jgi:hypothetical protein
MNTILKILVGVASIVIIVQGSWSGLNMYQAWSAQQETLARDRESADFVAAVSDCDAKASVYLKERTPASKADVTHCLEPLRHSAYFVFALQRLSDAGAPLDIK